jgi:cell division protein FtsL
MKLLRISNFIYLAGTVSLAALLFWTSQHVQDAQSQLREVEHKLSAEKRAAHVLEAEWHYLTRPQRLEQIAFEKLDIDVPREDGLLNTVVDIPEPKVPVLPQVRPASFSFTVQGALKAPSVQTIGVPAEASPSPVKKEPALQVDDRQRFDELLGRLSGEGGE